MFACWQLILLPAPDFDEALCVLLRETWDKLWSHGQEIQPSRVQGEHPAQADS